MKKNDSAELAAGDTDTTVVPADQLTHVAEALKKKMADGPGYGIEGPHVAHTPGPWTVETQWASDVDDNQFPFGHWIAGAEGEQIAEQIFVWRRVV